MSGVTRALSQDGKLSKKGPTGHFAGPTSQHPEKSWEMMLNSDVDSYAKTLKHRKIIRKTQKNNNLPKAKRILKLQYH